MADNRGRTDLRDKLVERFGRFGEAFYMFVLGMIAISVNGFAAYFLKYPFALP